MSPCDVGVPISRARADIGTLPCQDSHGGGRTSGNAAPQPPGEAQTMPRSRRLARAVACGLLALAAAA
ncbi:MAG TPA: hypothetical protein VIR00_16055, partial [Micromonosporaceae bacterium]